MRCCSRSTTWRASVLVAIALVLGVVAPSAAVDEAAVGRAIASAARRLVGPSADVTVRELRLVRAEELEGSVFASLPADARAGVPLRVVLKVVRADGRATRFGEAHCVIVLALPGVRARRAVSRGETLEAGDVEAAVIDATGWPLRSVPVEVAGARAVVDIPAGQVLQKQMIVPAPLVRGGETVTITVRSGGLQVQTQGVASQPGRLGDVIRVVNAGSGRRLSARVVGPASVEVQHGS
jgi:flagella basal body P-ring formation protein FlgA